MAIYRQRIRISTAFDLGLEPQQTNNDDSFMNADGIRLK